MIRYQITKKALEKLVTATAANWLADAAVKTEHFRSLGKYDETGLAGISWRDVVQVYMTIQHNKCAYCERKLAGGDAGKIEHDIEHFRPKSKVRSWPTPKIKKELNLDYDFSTGGMSPIGYYLLPYNLFNYITSCKVCNTIFKSDYFPIAGQQRSTATDDFKLLKSEAPLLLYPLGAIDVDPETVITFQGMIPVARSAHGKGSHLRARVTIDFFRLAVGREDLLRERALVIKALYLAHHNRNSSDQLNRDNAQLTIKLALHDSGTHANCARSFYAVCENDPATAQSYYDAAVDYLSSKGF